MIQFADREWTPARSESSGSLGPETARAMREIFEKCRRGYSMPDIVFLPAVEGVDYVIIDGDHVAIIH